VLLSALGEIVTREWQRIAVIRPWIALDEFIVMPDHLHGILVFKEDSGNSASVAPSRIAASSLGAVIGQFKSNCTKEIWRTGHKDFAWQERFFDQIVRNERALASLRAYIRDNPLRWEIESQAADIRRDAPEAGDNRSSTTTAGASQPLKAAAGPIGAKKVRPLS
jgi:REP element-mobilizing transposase RayT